MGIVADGQGQINHAHIDDMEINGGVLYVADSEIDEVTITDGRLEAHDTLIGGNLTMVAGLGNEIDAEGLRVNGGMDLNGGQSSQEVRIRGLTMGNSGLLDVDGDFDEFIITGLIALDEFGTGDSRVDLNGVVSGFTVKGVILKAARHGLYAEGCANGDIDLAIFDPSRETDNTYDGFHFVNCDNTRVRGSVHGAVNETNNPRYGWATDVDCTAIHVDVEVYGAQTGEYLNSANLEVSLTPRFSTETPTDGDMAVWDNAAGLWRPESAVGS